jgi:hypothetical protein
MSHLWKSWSFGFPVMLTSSGVKGRFFVENYREAIICLQSVAISPRAHSAVEAIINQLGKGQG